MGDGILSNGRYSADVSWFSLLRTTIASGDMARMKPYAFTVYCVIKSYANYATGDSYPSVETISNCAGISLEKCGQSIKQLEKMGYIKVEKIGRNNHYKAVERVGIRDTQSNSETVAQWEYAPNLMQHAISEIKNMLNSGSFEGQRIVNIEKLVVNVNSGSGNQININGEILSVEQLTAIVGTFTQNELAEKLKNLVAGVKLKNPPSN